jgi:Tfp pilus assembly protein PilN
MTTTLTSPEPAASAQPAVRMLPTANLLPVEVVENRRTRKVRRAVLVALGVFVLLLAGWYGYAKYQTSIARSDLTSVEDDVQRLLRQQNDFKEVVTAQAESRAIRTQLSALLADDLQWSRLLRSLQAAAPRGVQVTGVSGVITTRAADGAPAAAAPGGATGGQTEQLPSTSGEKAVGTLTVTGSGTSKVTVAAYVDALGKVSGLGNPLFGGANLQDGMLQFSVRLDITASALSGRYTKNSGAASGGS